MRASVPCANAASLSARAPPHANCWLPWQPAQGSQGCAWRVMNGASSALLEGSPELLCCCAGRLRRQVLNLGLAKDDVGVRGGALVHVRLVDHKQDLRQAGGQQSVSTAWAARGENRGTQEAAEQCGPGRRVPAGCGCWQSALCAATRAPPCCQLHAQGCVSHARSAPFTTSATVENTAGAHVLALPDLHAHHAGHRLHAQLLHRLAALLLAARLLAAGAALLAYGGQPRQSMGMVGQTGGAWPTYVLDSATQLTSCSLQS